MRSNELSNQDTASLLAILRVEPNDAGPGTPAFLIHVETERRFLLRVGTCLELDEELRKLGLSGTDLDRVVVESLDGSIASLSLVVDPARLLALGYEEVRKIVH